MGTGPEFDQGWIETGRLCFEFGASPHFVHTFFSMTLIIAGVTGWLAAPKQICSTPLRWLL